MNTVTTLISCMYEKNANIIARSNIQTDVVVVNQCDYDSIEEFEFKNKKGVTCRAKFINTTERGLSRSRNMAIANSWGDICYMCDDDELLADDYEQKMIEAYERHPQCSIIVFSLIRKNHTYPIIEQKIGLKEILRTSSVQTTFKRADIISHNILFDEKMGSGTGNGGGEENKFLMDCKRVGLKLWYVPQVVAEVKSEDSQWFQGFTEQYFRNFAWASRRIMGPILGGLYTIYWIIFRRKKYKPDLTLFEISKACFKGYFEKR